jgi:hypothetical protein
MAEHRIAYMRLDEITGAHLNPKMHAEADIVKAIETHGFGEAPMLDERTERLVAGHGRLKALGFLHRNGRRVPSGIHVADDGMWEIPVQRGWKSKDDAHALAYLVGSNKLSEKGGHDDRELLEALSLLQDEQLVDVTGFGYDDIANLEALMELGAWDAPGSKPKLSSVPTGDDDMGQDDEDVFVHGAAEDKEMWPQIAVKVPPHVFDAWRLFIDQYDGKDDAAKLIRLLTDLGHLS